MSTAKSKSRKGKRHCSTSQSSSCSSSDSASSSPEKRRPKKRKKLPQILIQSTQILKLSCCYNKQQELKLTKQKNYSKGTEGFHVPNYSTEDQSLTWDILSQIDLEEDTDCQTGQKIPESFPKRIELKRAHKAYSGDQC